MLTGDTLFIGDVGRPDLLASEGASADDLARQRYHSLHERLLSLPDDTLVYTAHGAGSACGKNLSTDTVSTIGDQRRNNYALAPMTEDAFVEVVTHGQAAAPMYFAYAANRNRQTRDTLNQPDETITLDLAGLLDAQHRGATVLDSRDANDFAAGHLRGSINVGLGGRFAEYAGEVLRAGTPIVLVTDPSHEEEARIRLARIGFDNIVGALDEPLANFAAYPDLIDRCFAAHRPATPTTAHSARLDPNRRRPQPRRDRERHHRRRPPRAASPTDRPARRTRPDAANRRLLRRRLSLQHRRQRPDRPRLHRRLRPPRGISSLGQPPTDSHRTGTAAMTTPEHHIPAIEPADLQTMPDAVLLDVREPGEWAAGHAPRAVHIPLGDLDRRAFELPADRAVVCICRSGRRSLQAAEILTGHGFDVHNLTGGMRAWSDAELAVVTPEGTPGQVI